MSHRYEDHGVADCFDFASNDGHSMPSGYVRELQDQHNVNLHGDGDGDDYLDNDNEDEEDDLQVMTEQELEDWLAGNSVEDYAIAMSAELQFQHQSTLKE